MWCMHGVMRSIVWWMMWCNSLYVMWCLTSHTMSWTSYVVSTLKQCCHPLNQTIWPHRITLSWPTISGIHILWDWMTFNSSDTSQRVVPTISNWTCVGQWNVVVIVVLKNEPDARFWCISLCLWSSLGGRLSWEHFQMWCPILVQWYHNAFWKSQYRDSHARWHYQWPQNK